MEWSGDYGTSNPYIAYQIGIEETDYSVSDNTSTFRTQIFIYRTNTGYTTYGSGTVYYRLKTSVGDVSDWYTYNLTTDDKITSDGIYVAEDTWGPRIHNAEGDLDVTLECYIEHDTFSSDSNEFTISTTHIPRTSQPTLDASNVDFGDEITIYTNRASSSFTHHIGIRAVDGEGGVKTSTVLKYRIEDGAPVGTATAEGPTPDVYQQLIAICSNIKDKTDALDSTIQMNTQELGKTKEYLNELTDKKITKFYASNLGENHLEDSDNGKIQDMFIYGRSEQKQYKGYNLLKDENVIVFNDGNYICSNQKYLNEGTIEIVTGETYTFSLGVVSTDGQIKLFDDSNNLIKSIYISNKRIFTFIVPENVVSMSYYAKITTDSTASLEKAKAMLIVGSEELAYEPYVGGIPSPNPDYPQEIRNVLNPSVMICGKNLIQCEDGKEYKLSDTTSNYIGVLVNYSGKINTQKGKKYTISFEYETSNPGIFCLNAFQNVITGNLLVKDNNIKSGKNKIAVTFVAEGIIKKGCLYIQFRRTIQDELFEITIRNIQIEEGEECTEYEPYKEQEASFPYTLNAIPVSSGGNITIDGQQYISDYIDVESKKLIKMTDSIILKGTENWKKSTSTDSDKFTLTTKDMTAMKRLGYCTHFGIVNRYTNTMGKLYRNEYSGTVQIVINFGDYGKTTLEDFKNWLSNNNITLTYERYDKSEINLTDKEINSFKNMQTYYLTTNICITSEELDGYTKFNYPLSMKNGWDYIKQQIGDTRDYIYDMEVETAEAYVNSEYAVALTELEVM